MILFVIIIIMQSQANIRIASTFLVEKEWYFSTSFYTLLLQQDELIKLPIERDSQGHAEKLPWASIIDVHASDRNLREFTLEVLNATDTQRLRAMDLAQRQQLALGKAQSLFHPSQMVFLCNERDKIVAELRHILHVKHFGGNPTYEEKCRFSTELEPSHDQQDYATQRLMAGFKSRQLEAFVRLHPTAIQVLSRQPEGERVMLSKDQNEKDTLISAQTKPKIFGGLNFSQIEDQDEIIERDVSDFFLKDQSEDERQMAGLIISQAEHRQLFQGISTSFDLEHNLETQNFLDKRKWSEEFKTGNRNTFSKSRPSFSENDDSLQDSGQEAQQDKLAGRRAGNIKMRQHFIYFSDLLKALVRDLTLVLVCKNQEVFSLTFDDTTIVEEFLKKLNDSFRRELCKYFNYTQLKTIESFASQISFIRAKREQPCFVMDLLSCQVDGNLKKARIELESNSFVEINTENNQVKRRCFLVDLETIRVTDKSSQIHLVLQFERSFHNNSLKDSEPVQNVIFALHFPDFESRERLLSCILTLRTLALASNQDFIRVDNLKVFHDDWLDLSQRVIGYMALDFGTGTFKQQVTFDYETNLLNKLSSQVQTKTKDLRQLNITIEEILINAKFTLLQNNTQLPAQIKAIFNDFCATLKDYYELENHHPSVVESSINQSFLKPKHIVNYFGRNQPQKGSRKSLVEQTELQPKEMLQQSQDHLIRYLNLVKILLNSKFFFAELANFPQLFEMLTLLLMSRNSVIALLSALVIKASIQHLHESEYKYELQNKNILVRGYIQAAKDVAQQSGSSKVAHPEGDFFDQVFAYFQYFEAELDRALHSLDSQGRAGDVKGSVKSLHLFSITQVLQALLQERKKGLFFQSKEMQVYVSTFTQRLIKMQDIYPKQQNECQHVLQPPPLKPDQQFMPFFHLLDKFCIIRSEQVDKFDQLQTDGFFDVRLQFSSLLATSLQYLIDQDDYFKKIQDYILNYSIQFIWHLHQQMSSVIKQQRQFSCRIITQLMFKNKESIGLVSRLYPSTVFAKIKTKELIDPYTGIVDTEWRQEEWTRFFNEVLAKNYNNSIEQWTDETRSELLGKLQSQIQLFTLTKTKHFKSITDDTNRDLVLPCHHFSKKYQVCTNQKFLKWNFNEFEVNYECLRRYYKVGKYFLVKLLGDSNMPLDANQRPTFSEAIIEPSEFLDELIQQFIASNDANEHEIILKTICILYRKHYDSIGPLRSLPFWLKLINEEQNKSRHFLMLQLVHIALNFGKDTKKEFVKQNLKKFIKTGGFQILHHCMNFVFKELQDSQNQRLKIQTPQNQGQDLNRIRQSILAEIAHAQELERGEKVEQKKILNFTNSSTNSSYFNRNTINVNIGILSLKIIDVIFKTMQFSDHLPLPSNRQFIYDRASLCTLTQMLILQNSDLTREVLSFIEVHLNSHFAFFNLKNTGIIELLILCLSTKHSNLALALLLKFQEVCIESNESLKFAFFNKNDLEMIREENKKNQKQRPVAKQFEYFEHQDPSMQKLIPLLQDSIFLRYMPVPFIKYLYEEREPLFLDVYKMDSFRSPILIWNKKMRLHLERKIRKNQELFVNKIAETAMHNNSKLEPLQEIVKFDELDNQVRCGRYYLSVWVEQKNLRKDRDPEKKKLFFSIPKEEEDEFHNKMQAELRYQNNEERLKNKETIITLFRSCLLAQQTFDKKRIVCINEIKTILKEACKLDAKDQGQCEYDENTKWLVYIGMRIIRKALMERETMKELIKMQGVEFIAEIVGFILKNALQHGSKLQFEEESKLTTVNEREVEDSRYSQDHSFQVKRGGNVTNKDEGGSCLRIDPIEAKTLNLCTEAIKMLVCQDIQAFVDLPLDLRIKIFFQMTQMLRLSFELYPTELMPNPRFKPRKLKEYSSTLHEHSRSGSQKHGLTFGQRKDLSVDGNNSRITQIKIKKRKNRKGPGEQKQFGSGALANTEGQFNQVATPSKNQGKGVTYNVDQLHEQETMQNELFQVQRETELVKQSNQVQKNDKKYLTLIFGIARTVFSFAQEIALYPVLHPDLIASGLAWQGLQHLYFDLVVIEDQKRDETLQESINSILVDSALMLKQLISFAANFTEAGGGETYKIKNLVREPESLILKNFYQCIQNFFTTKFQQRLRAKYQVNNEQNKLDFVDQKDDPKCQEFFKLFSASCIEQPEIVWNDHTRNEMLAILRSQLQAMAMFLDQEQKQYENQFQSKIRDFRFSVYDEKLRIKNIFVHYFNKAIEKNQNYDEFESEKKNSFAQEIIQTINQINRSQHPENDKIKELVMAFKNLVVSLQYKISDPQQFNSQFGTLCNLIRFNKESQASFEHSKHLSNLVFDIVRHIVESENPLYAPEQVFNPLKPQQTEDLGGGKPMAESLLESDDFIDMMIRVMYKEEMKIVAFDTQFLIILDDLIKLRQDQVKYLFIDRSLILFLLNLIFSSDSQMNGLIQEETRAHLVGCVLKIEQQITSVNSSNQKGVLQAFIPPNFFLEIKEQMRRKDNAADLNEKFKKFLKYFDQPSYENVFVKWNKDLKRESHKRIRELCDDLISKKDCNLSLDTISSHEMWKEKIIDKVILRIYNKNPAVFIGTQLTSFITDVSAKIYKLSQQLYDFNFKHSEEQFLNKSQKTKNVRYQYLCYKAQVQLTSLLLSLEQLLNNEFNPNLPIIRRNENSQGLGKFSEIIMDSFTKSKEVIEDRVYLYLKMWLQNPVFLDEAIDKNIRITFLQVVYLVVELERTMAFFKQDQVPLQFVQRTIRRIAEEPQSTDINQICENKLTLMIAHNMIMMSRNQQDQLKYLYDSIYREDTLKLLEQKRQEKTANQFYDYSWFLLTYLQALNQQTKEPSQDSVYKRYQEMNLKSKWYSKPGSAKDSENHYDKKRVTFIELANEQQIIQELFKYPILSEQSMKECDESLLSNSKRFRDQVKQGEDIFQEEATSYFEDEI